RPWLSCGHQGRATEFSSRDAGGGRAPALENGGVLHCSGLTSACGRHGSEVKQRVRCLPTSHGIPLPRTVAAICCPSRCSTTGRHGTSENTVPSSNIA